LKASEVVAARDMRRYYIPIWEYVKPGDGTLSVSVAVTI
jgi:hypothetical protein